MSLLVILSLLAASACNIARSSSESVDLRAVAPVVEAETAKGTQTAVFAGGCFWGVEAVFEHVKGVSEVRSGYAGGDAKSADYDKVSSGSTTHAESVQVTFDPEKVSYTQLLTIFFSVAHDPTEVNRQGPDVGPQYRSAIFYTTDAQRKAAMDYIKAIDGAKVFAKPIATQVVALDKFYDAEAYHQDYVKKNPDAPYVVYHDLPKLAALKEKFPELYTGKK